MTIQAVAEKCINQLENEFVEHPFSFYTEQSVQSYLYHLLVEAGLNRCLPTFGGEGHLVRQVQVEYPPVEASGGRRGQYDLVVFDAATIESINWWNHRRVEGRRKLPIPPAVAIELGLNKGVRGKPTDHLEIPDIGKELERLARTENQVKQGYVLYFYRYESSRAGSVEQVRDLLMNVSKRYPGPIAKMTAVSYNHRRHSDPARAYRLRVQDGRSSEHGILG
jgi:hypothetical protein